MKKILAAIVVAALGLGTSPTQAAVIGTVGKVTRVQTGAAGEGIYVSIDQTLNTGCSQKSFAFMPTSALQYKETYSTVLLAMSQGKAITLYYDSAAACGSANAAVLLAVAVAS